MNFRGLLKVLGTEWVHYPEAGGKHRRGRQKSKGWQAKRLAANKRQKQARKASWRRG